MNIERALRIVSGWAFGVVIILIAGGCATALAQEEGSKGIKAEEFDTILRRQADARRCQFDRRV